MNEGDSLPIRHSLPEILQHLANRSPVALKAPPGAGKTTGVPPALLASDVVPKGQILLAQPRRLAARSAAAQLARRSGSALGETVGYHVRFDRRESARTRLLVLTYGMLLRRMQSDPLLENVACVLLDEFHERSLEADLALGMIERVRRSLRPELRLVVMSATLDPEPLVQFLGDGQAVTSEGRMYPVDIRYRPGAARQPVAEQVVDAIPEALAATDGHLLVFLPGVGEIRRAQRLLESRAGMGECAILPLYADLAVEEQDRAMQPSPQRKIILATNVAETSITIDGVTGVIDSGTSRVSRFDAKIALPRLRVEPISQASADQRSGRAGRTRPGVCWRLWHRDAHRSRAIRDVPEILRADFAPAALILVSWGEDDAEAFPWLDPPTVASVEQSRVLLQRLGAIDADGRITAEGRQMAELPVHPRLAKLLIVAARHGIVADAALAAALLTERDPFRDDHAAGEASAAPHPSRCDMVASIERLRKVAQAGGAERQRSHAVKHVIRVAGQLESLVRKLDVPNRSGTAPGDASVRLRQSLLAAFPDRVARRREPQSSTALLVGGKGVQIQDRSSARDSELVLCLRIGSVDVNAHVDLASAIERDWLDPRWLSVVDEPIYQPRTHAFVARRREYFLDLLLAETPIECKPSSQSAEILAREAKAHWKQNYPPDIAELESFLGRVDLLRRVLGEDVLPAIDDAWFEELRRQLAVDALSLDQLRNAPWLRAVRDRLEYSQLQAIEREAPARMQVPSGNSIAIDYSVGKPPAMHVRLQELFGWHDTPRVAQGRQPLQLHLLGPNGRTQQITSDLRRFWESTYSHVRKDLRARYPKHHWPEDPFAANATRHGLKPR